jgi:hypothetical protein
MPTKNPRINITFEADTAELLNKLAIQEHKSVSSLAKELILDALDRREDKALSALGDALDVPNAKRIKEEDAWN